MTPIILKAPEDIESLFHQALVGSYKGEPYQDILRRYTELVQQEFQHQIYSRLARRETDDKRRERKRSVYDSQHLA